MFVFQTKLMAAEPQNTAQAGKARTVDLSMPPANAFNGKSAAQSEISSHVNAYNKVFVKAEALIVKKYGPEFIDQKEVDGTLRGNGKFHTYAKTEGDKVTAVVQGYDITVGNKKYFFECYTAGKPEDVAKIYGEAKISKPIVVEAAPNEVESHKKAGFSTVLANYAQPLLQQDGHLVVMPLMVKGAAPSEKEVPGIVDAVYKQGYKTNTPEQWNQVKGTQEYQAMQKSMGNSP